MTDTVDTTVAVVHNEWNTFRAAVLATGFDNLVAMVTPVEGEVQTVDTLLLSDVYTVFRTAKLGTKLDVQVERNGSVTTLNLVK